MNDTSFGALGGAKQLAGITQSEIGSLINRAEQIAGRVNMVHERLLQSVARFDGGLKGDNPSGESSRAIPSGYIAHMTVVFADIEGVLDRLESRATDFERIA